jgi:SOS-response transcriptional repressor LexA
MSEGTGIKRGNLYTYVDHLVKVDKKLVKQDIKDRKVAKKDNEHKNRKPNFPRLLLPAKLSIKAPIENVPGFYSLHWAGHIAANSSNPLVVLDLLDSDSTIDVPKHLLPSKISEKDLYVLQVNGDSMTKAHISNGDYVVILSGSQSVGDIVVVYIKDKNAVTLKLLKQTQRGNVKLQPESHKHQPRIEKPDNIEIQGRVVAVMRKC